MTQLCCSCLNITVSVTGDWRAHTRPTSSLVSQTCAHPFLANNELLYEVQLDVAGIIVRQGHLVACSTMEDWVLTSCANCHTHVYITHSFKTDRTFVTTQLLSSPEAIQKVSEQDNFSVIFKILLQLQEEADVLRRKRVSSMSFGREDPDMKLVHQQMKDYLTQQEDALEERIRLYEKQQRLEFQMLQEKAHKERSTLFTTMAQMRDTATSDVKKATSTVVVGTSGSNENTIKSKTTTMTTPTSNTATSSALPRVSKQHGRQQQQHKAGSNGSSTVTITLREDSPYSITQASGRVQVDEDAMFSLDGFEMEEREGAYRNQLAAASTIAVAATGGDAIDLAFPQSDDDDEEISTDDSSFRDMSAVSGMNYGTSVPVNIPMYHKPGATAQPSSVGEASGGREGEGGGEGEFEWRELGNCIRQLALSVQDTGMFGDLPRPRIMSKAHKQ